MGWGGHRAPKEVFLWQFLPTQTPPSPAAAHLELTTPPVEVAGCCTRNGHSQSSSHADLWLKGSHYIGRPKKWRQWRLFGWWWCYPFRYLLPFPPPPPLRVCLTPRPFSLSPPPHPFFGSPKRFPACRDPCKTLNFGLGRKREKR